MAMSCKPLPANASSSIRRSRERPSNPTSARLEHLDKHALPSTKSESGRAIAFNPLFEKADSWILSNLEPLSNIIHSSAKHREKHDLRKTSTLSGIVAHHRLLRKKAASAMHSSLDPSSNAITAIAYFSPKLPPSSQTGSETSLLIDSTPDGTHARLPRAENLPLSLSPFSTTIRRQ
jgi:hypothetical protein